MKEFGTVCGCVLYILACCSIKAETLSVYFKVRTFSSFVSSYVSHSMCVLSASYCVLLLHKWVLAQCHQIPSFPPGCMWALCLHTTLQTLTSWRRFLWNISTNSPTEWYVCMLFMWDYVLITVCNCWSWRNGESNHSMGSPMDGTPHAVIMHAIPSWCYLRIYHYTYCTYV